MTNAELVKKVDIALSDLASDGGALNAEQSDRFIRNMIDQPTLIGAVRTIPMNAPTRKVDRIGFGSRILRSAKQARSADTTPDQRALGIADRAKPDLDQIELNTSEVIAEVRLPYEVLEDNIERGNIRNTILALIAERATLDLEELLILGDSASADPFLALQDGVLKRLTSNVVDGTGFGIGSSVYNEAIKALPTRYRRNKGLMRFFVESDVEQDYRQNLAERLTVLGDNTTTGGGSNPIPVHGINLVPNTFISANTGILTNPQNILFGIQRNITIEVEKNIKTREWIIVLTARVAVAVEEEEATVRIDNLGL